MNRSLMRFWGGTLLVAGTMIGVGMLALPIATGEGGFIPAATTYLICWLFMLCTGLLLLEVCTWMPEEANLITMAKRLLGPKGKTLCWIVYLFLFITIMIAHVDGGGAVLRDFFGSDLPKWTYSILYALIFSPVVYLGTKWVGRLNMVLMAGVILTYLLFIPVSYSEVDVSLLARSDWPKAWMAIPVLFTAFTFQVIIPTLMTYMKRDVRKVRLAVIWGTTIPLIVYLFWEFLILGIVPLYGPFGLKEAANQGWNAIRPLQELIQDPYVFRVGRAFAFFAMTTSYIALSLAYLDFLSDGLNIAKQGIKKALLCLGIFLPPTLIAVSYPHIFLKALHYAGGFSCAILFGLFPPLMVWVGRYHKKKPEQPQVPGGKLFLGILIFLVVAELGLQIISLL